MQDTICEPRHLAADVINRAQELGGRILVSIDGAGASGKTHTDVLCHARHLSVPEVGQHLEGCSSASSL